MKTFDNVLNDFVGEHLLGMLVCYGRYLGSENISLFASSAEFAEIIHDYFVSGGDTPCHVESYFREASWYPIAFGETSAEAFKNLQEKGVRLYSKYHQEGKVNDWRTAIQIVSSSRLSEAEKSNWKPEFRLTDNFEDYL